MRISTKEENVQVLSKFVYSSTFVTEMCTPYH